MYDYNRIWNTLHDHETAIDALSNALKDGSLAIFLGAGVSKGLGLPGWYDLVKRCCQDIKIDINEMESLSNEEILASMMKVRSKCNIDDEYHSLIRRNLYKSIKNEIQIELVKNDIFENASLIENILLKEEISNYPSSLFHNQLLMSIISLTIGSTRGSVDNIINYNFDDVLETLLEHLGMNIEIINSFPTLFTKTHVNIFHPNGFIPLQANHLASDFIILDEESYEDLNDRMSTDPWMNQIKSIMQTHICLFIGLSGDDKGLKSVIRNTHKILNEDRPIGFWLYKQDSNPNRNKEYWRKYGIIRLDFKTHEEYPSFIFKISQNAR